jgi:hypothetical protein
LYDGGSNLSHVQSIPLSGRSDAQVRQWLGEVFGARNLDVQALDQKAPYDIPAHPIDHGTPYDAIESADGLIELAAWYANAKVLLDRVQSQMSNCKLAVSPVCCWPHHFDLATLTMLPTPNVDVTGYVGAGFSPGDEYYDEPYFYVSVYPEPDPAILPILPAMGHWHTHEFTAGVMPAHQILAVSDQAAATEEFLQGALAFGLKIFGKVL